MGCVIFLLSYDLSPALEFELKNRLIELGTRSNSITLTVQDAFTGNPVPGATATNESGTKMALCTLDGVVVFESIRTGTQNFTFSAAGHTTTTVQVKMVKGKNTEMVVKLGK